jgi:hypothetical protein
MELVSVSDIFSIITSTFNDVNGESFQTEMADCLKKFKNIQPS